MTNLNRSVLYIGVTSDLNNRLWQHENHYYDGFTKKYKCVYLIYYEYFESIIEAIDREKVLKRLLRIKKFELISKKNKTLRFLNSEIYEDIYSLMDDF